MEEGAIGIIRRVTNSGFLGSLVRKSGKNLVFLNESVFDKDSLNVEDANSVRIEVLRKGTTLVIT